MVTVGILASNKNYNQKYALQKKVASLAADLARSGSGKDKLLALQKQFGVDTLEGSLRVRTERNALLTEVLKD
jgi:hypothetical protein